MSDAVPPDFTKVARMIAGDPAPEWLESVLDHYGREYISARERERVPVEGIVQQIKDAADTLLEWLPRLQYGLGGHQFSPDVPVVLDALARLKPDLDRLRSKKPDHRSPDVRRQFCADVIVEAWRFVHIEVQPYSEKLYDACAAYWLACGRPEIGKKTNNPSQKYLKFQHQPMRVN